MKRILSYLLICIYATVMVKPVMPTITDIFAHLFNYSEHMTTVHHHHGKAHVHFEYIEAAKNNSHGDDPYNNIPKKTETCSEHIMFTTGSDLLYLLIPQDHLNSLLQNLTVVCLQNDLRPPITFLT